MTSFVIYHTDKLFQKSFSASWLHTPAFEIKKFELRLCSYDAEPTAQQQARGKAKASDNSGRRWDYGARPDTLCGHGIKTAWTALAGKREGCLSESVLSCWKMIRWTKVVDSPVPDTLLKEDGSKARASDLLPDKEPDGELAWGSQDKGRVLKKDELCSSYPQVKWFNASVLLKTDSLKAHVFKGEETTSDHFLLKFLPVIRRLVLDATPSSTAPWEWPRTAFPSQPSHRRSRLHCNGTDAAGTGITPASALGTLQGTGASSGWLSPSGCQ